MVCGSRWMTASLQYTTLPATISQPGLGTDQFSLTAMEVEHFLDAEKSSEHAVSQMLQRDNLSTAGGGQPEISDCTTAQTHWM